MDVTFWGVRGSIPCCGQEYLRVGGNSSCVSVIIDKKIVVFDAGTGLRDLGNWLEKHPYINEAHLFLSHAHYDHIIGFPFFKPLWRKDFKLVVYSTIFGKYGGAKQFFEKRVFTDPFFPVTLEKLQCRLSFKDCQDNDRVTLDKETNVLIGKLNHPGGASGFRLQHRTKSVVYVSDTEHKEEELDSEVLNLIQGSDLVIYDATFTEEEYPQYKGWGHSTWQEGMKLCQKAGAKSMAIYHHDPSHTDDVIDLIEKEATRAWSGLFIARQGMVISLDEID